MVVGCQPSSREDPFAAQQEIVGGEWSGPDDDAVLKLESANAEGIINNCTATLVAPNLIITARHCVANFSSALRFTCDADGNLSAGPGGQTGTLNDATKVSVKSGATPTPRAVAKGLQIFAAQTSTICRNDFALVLLDRALDQPPTSLPILPIRLYSGVEPREPIRILGYGAVRSGADSGSGTRHTRSGIPVSKVGSSIFRPVGDGVPPRTFTTDGPGGCYVDSGGPALSEHDAVIGVFSQFVGDCLSPTTVNYFTEVAPFRDDVILPAFKASGYEPWLEGNSEPGLYGTGGGAGTGGESSTGGVASTAAGGSSGSSTSGESGGTTAVVSASGGESSVGSSGGGALSASGGATGGGPLSSVAIGGAAIDTGGTPSTGGGTAVAVVYDKGPSSGGSCGCRMGPRRGYGLGALALLATAVAARRRRAARG